MTKTADAMEKARHIVAVIDHSYSDKLITTLLRLEVLATEQEPSPTAYFDGKSMFRCLLVQADRHSC